ncbi:hypothetical protein BRADI_2g26296v3 [Brachypodium distachyon]|uniref:Uncharacterized protein n=1 Tax=Brachypodium distachyon TaxID=15368 RepID=A0A2K2DAL0_BRADI|nr:hypothetical protein BRADI_2g26296v3 [Brachypodium distachyon]
MSKLGSGICNTLSASTGHKVVLTRSSSHTPRVGSMRSDTFVSSWFSPLAHYMRQIHASQRLAFSRHGELFDKMNFSYMPCLATPIILAWKF